ncbi:hypothetical protein [Actinomyces ruminicola]|uniref:Uncharacterized protein n=1 Tax=Actinomyces ruminicola TaxID=332524 RepID=A0A1G9S3G8_9ACTO|nr:hypothetical protein [Actinomyces ruminicola]SDM29807.1 hypothetical protein SAMN04487766_101263 [Actinomyces ruminicola]
MTRSTHLLRPLTLAATGLAAVVLTASMSACSSNSSDASSASSASDQAVAVETTGTEADADAEDSTAAVPEGFTLVEVPEYGISVAVPSDWDTLTSANTSDAELVGRIAQALDDSEDEVVADLADTPLVSVDTASDTPSALYLTRDDEDGPLPSEEMMQELADNHNADSTDYRETTSGSGANAAIFTMSAADGDTQHNLSAVAVSDGDNAFFMVVVVSDSEERVKEVSDAVLASF